MKFAPSALHFGCAPDIMAGLVRAAPRSLPRTARGRKGGTGALLIRRIKSSTEGSVWPAVPSRLPATLLAIQYQLEQSQWLPPESLRLQQFTQLQALLRHAAGTVPYYKKRLAEAGIDAEARLDDGSWARVPLLARRDIQGAGDRLASTAPPKAHGKVHEMSTSGSTGMPVTTRGTELTRVFWLAFTLRDQIWQDFDFSKTMAAIRHVPGDAAKYPKGARAPGWGPATDPIFETVPSYLLSIATPVEQQLEWLVRHKPEYLITYPSNLMALLMHSKAERIRLPGLRFVETLSEILHPEVRDACREVWGVKITDMYSSQEVGYMALQCPDHEHYHVQAENVLLEILDQAGRPCAPGETGRVVVTTLHNYAMPLIRYDMGDFAVAGEPCPCGRGLPVITRILGRVRNMLTLPSGGRVWPYFGGDSFAKIAPVRQYQVVQKSLTGLELRVVAQRPLTSAEEDALRKHIAKQVGEDFTITFSYHEEIARSKGGKFEDFRSELAG